MARVGGPASGAFWALAAGLVEFVGGLLMAFGLFHPVGPLAIIAVMLMAIALVHGSKGLWMSNGGGEYNLVLLAIVAVLGLTGPHRYALDSLLGTALPQPQAFWIGLAIVLLGLIAGLAFRRVEKTDQPLSQAGSAARLPRCGISLVSFMPKRSSVRQLDDYALLRAQLHAAR